MAKSYRTLELNQPGAGLSVTTRSPEASVSSWAGSYGQVGKMALLLSAAALVPALGLGQEITGPLVNALLILAVGLVGVSNAILIGLVPSLMAWGRGTLPAPLIVLLPYIASGNALLILACGTLGRRHYWLGVLVGAALKCAFLWAIVTLMGRAPLAIQFGSAVTPVPVPPSYAAMFQYPQFLTAVAGGVLAWAVREGYRVWAERSSK